MDRGAWRATVREVTDSWAGLSDSEAAVKALPGPKQALSLVP